MLKEIMFIWLLLAGICSADYKIEHITPRGTEMFKVQDITVGNGYVSFINPSTRKFTFLMGNIKIEDNESIPPLHINFKKEKTND